MKDVRTAAGLVRPIVGAVGGKIDLAAFVIQALSERFSQMAKFAEIGQLATGIIHEINNPVACLRSDISILLREFPRLAALMHSDNAEAAELLRDVHQILEDLTTSVELVTSISRNLKSLAYSAHDAPKETDLHECIGAALRVAGHELKYRVRVEKEFGTLPRLVAYPGLLIQVFLNLFVNAAQAIEGEGVLRIRTRPDANGVVVEVSNTGRGIAPENLSKIFRPFFTTKPLGVGLGLGLSICKQIIDRHGGELEVSSSPGQGTMFRIRLPREVQRERQPFGSPNHLTFEPSILAAAGSAWTPRGKRNPGAGGMLS